MVYYGYPNSYNYIRKMDKFHQIAEKIMTIYLGSTQHPMAQKLMSFVKNVDSVIIEIKPMYFSTWDYSESS
jgi:hypothetical protein